MSNEQAEDVWKQLFIKHPLPKNTIVIVRNKHFRGKQYEGKVFSTGHKWWRRKELYYEILTNNDGLMYVRPTSIIRVVKYVE